MEIPDVVWVIVAGALVLFMTPGLALFYGGLTQTKSAVNMMMMSFAAMGLVALTWALWGNAVAGADAVAGGLFGNPAADFALFESFTDQVSLLDVGFGATFAIITTALISGAIADRAKFSAWMIFVPIWVTLVYAPLAFWVWGDGGLLTTGFIGSAVGEAVDFAGGLVVHMCAGLAALALVLVIGPRSNFAPTKPHNVPFVLLGASILWFGWFGFNVGEAGDASQAGINWINTMLAPAGALVAWLITEWARGKKPTPVGAASGIVAGLVAITPACAYVNPLGAIILGIVSGVICCFAVDFKYGKYDDTLDVVGLHFVAGLWGTVAIGLFGSEALIQVDFPEHSGGLLLGGGFALLWAQIVACVVTLVFAFVATYLIGLAIHKTIGFRVESDVEDRGIDSVAHQTEAYAPEVPALR